LSDVYGVMKYQNYSLDTICKTSQKTLTYYVSETGLKICTKVHEFFLHLIVKFIILSR